MTLVVALKRFLSEEECEKDDRAELLVFADSKETVGMPPLISRKTRKVYPIVSWKKKSELDSERYAAPLAIWSGAGDSLALKRGREICERLLNQMFVEKWNKRCPEFTQFEEAVKEIGNQLKKDRLLRRNTYEMVLGSVDLHGKVSLYAFEDDGTPDPVHSEPGYAILGKGYIIGAHMLIDLLGYELSNSWRFEADTLASFLIDRVHEVDPSVGAFEGDGYIMRCGKGGILLERTASFDDYQNRALYRTEIFRSAWELCDSCGERRILKEMRARLMKVNRSRKFK